MTVPTPTPPAPARPARARVPKTIWDLVFTLLIPIAILSPNILGSGVSVANLLGGDTQANIHAYLIAALVPVAYVLTDLLINRRLSPIAALGGATALFSGALAFWQVSGLLYALKDSARPFLTAVFAFVSAYTAYPLFRIFLDAASIAESPEHRAATRQVTRAPEIGRAMAVGTLLFGAGDLVAAVVNSVVNYHLVVARFGTAAFNLQKAQADAVMRLPSLGLSFVGLGLAYWVVQRAVTARYGAGASLLEPEKLAERLRERGELQAAE